MFFKFTQHNKQHCKIPIALKHATWHECYDTCLTSSVTNKDKMEHMMKRFDSNLSESEAKTAMSKKNIVVITRTCLNKILGIIHHANIVGGKIEDLEEECAFLVGLDRTNIVIATPYVDFFLRKLHLETHHKERREDPMDCASLE